MSNQSALAALRGEAHTSVSAINTYIMCPKKYELHYLVKADPSHRSVPLAFGSAVHGALATFYQALQRSQQSPSKQELQEKFHDLWRHELDNPLPVLFDEKNSPASIEKMGIDLMGVFHDQAPRPVVHEVEMAFSVEVIDWETGEVLPTRLVGALDLVVEDESSAESSHRIVEVKTAARRWSAQQLQDNLQLTGYSWAGTQLGLGEAPIDLYLLLKTKTPAFEMHQTTRTRRDHQDFLSVVVGVHRAIAAGAFYPVRSWACASCQYAGQCMAG